ncbi:MAG: DNA repair protein RecO [Pseudomonadota bacterium]
MLNWQDQAITIATKRYGERNYLSWLLTKEHGKYSGYCRIYSRSSRNLLQRGQLVNVKWQARLAEQLGNFQLDLIQPLPWLIIENNHLLNVINYLCYALYHLLPEREVVSTQFDSTLGLIEALSTGDWWRQLLHFELTLLKTCGYPLMLTKCNVNGSVEDLAYISPRTGAAVSAVAARGYEAKLLPWQPLLIDPLACTSATNQEICAADEVVQFFMHKFLFKQHDLLMPATRKNMLSPMVSA